MCKQGGKRKFQGYSHFQFWQLLNIGASYKDRQREAKLIGKYEFSLGPFPFGSFLKMSEKIFYQVIYMTLQVGKRFLQGIIV